MVETQEVIPRGGSVPDAPWPMPAGVGGNAGPAPPGPGLGAPNPAPSPGRVDDTELAAADPAASTGHAPESADGNAPTTTNARPARPRLVSTLKKPRPDGGDANAADAESVRGRPAGVHSENPEVTPHGHHGAAPAEIDPAQDGERSPASDDGARDEGPADGDLPATSHARRREAAAGDGGQAGSPGTSAYEVTGGTNLDGNAQVGDRCDGGRGGAAAKPSRGGANDAAGAGGVPALLPAAAAPAPTAVRPPETATRKLVAVAGYGRPHAAPLARLPAPRAPGSPATRRRKETAGLSDEAKAYLIKWLNEHKAHPYPSRQEKDEMRSLLKISDPVQLDGWLCRARKKLMCQTSQRSSQVPKGITKGVRGCPTGARPSNSELATGGDKPAGDNGEEASTVIPARDEANAPAKLAPTKTPPAVAEPPASAARKLVAAAGGGRPPAAPLARRPAHGEPWNPVRGRKETAAKGMKRAPLPPRGNPAEGLPSGARFNSATPVARSAPSESKTRPVPTRAPFLSVPPPSNDVQSWTSSMSVARARSSVAAGLRVKVRRAPPLEGSGAALALAGRPGGALEYTLWRGGRIAAVSDTGVSVVIEFDDGAVQTTVFPNVNAVVDDVGNGTHCTERWCSIDAFLPGPRCGGSEGPGRVRDRGVSSGSRPGVSFRGGEAGVNTYERTLVCSDADGGANTSSHQAAARNGASELKASMVCVGGVAAKKSRGGGLPTPFTSVDNQHQSNKSRQQRLPKQGSTPMKPHCKSSSEVAGFKCAYCRALVPTFPCCSISPSKKRKSKVGITRVSNRLLARNEKLVKSVSKKQKSGSPGSPGSPKPSARNEIGGNAGPAPPAPGVGATNSTITSQSRDDINLPSGVSLRSSGKWQVIVHYKSLRGASPYVGFFGSRDEAFSAYEAAQSIFNAGQREGEDSDAPSPAAADHSMVSTPSFPDPATEEMLPPAKLFELGVVSLIGKISPDNSTIKGIWAPSYEEGIEMPELCGVFEYKSESSSEANGSGEPTSGSFTGWIDEDDERIEEKDLTIRFKKNSEGYYNLEGSCCNKLGRYKLSGLLKGDGTCILFKHTVDSL